MTRCTRVTTHPCRLGRHLPDLTADPADQSRTARLLGGLLLLMLLFAAALVPS